MKSVISSSKGKVITVRAEPMTTRTAGRDTYHSNWVLHAARVMNSAFYVDKGG